MDTDKVTITAPSKELLTILKQAKAVLPRSKAAASRTTLELTIKTNQVSIAIPGAIFSLTCQTEGTAKASLPFLHFYDIVKAGRDHVLLIQINEGRLRIRNVTVNARTFFFQNDTILRSIQLPANYTDLDLIRLPELYTPQEIEFNKLTDKVQAANLKLNNAITRAASILQDYSVPRFEIRALAMEYVFKKQ